MTFSEEDLRPADLMRRKAAALEADVQFLRDRRDSFAEVPCPACGGDHERGARTKDVFRYATCADCETVWMNPRAPEPVLAEFYRTSQNYDFWNTHIFPATEGVRRERLFRPRARRLLELCEEHGVRPGRLLEVGAGAGLFCDEVAVLGVFDSIVAVEPTPGLAQTCRDRGIDTVELPIEEVDLPPSSIDVIAAWEVIEHLRDPLAFVRSCASLLRPGGVLIVSCPNVKGFDMVVLGTEATAVDHEHLNYFHPASLSLLMRRAGLTAIATETPGRLDAELVRNRFLDGRLAADAHPALHHLLVDEWDTWGGPFQEFLASHGLSSHQWCVAQREPGATA